MNDRILELAEQAGITTNLDTDYFEKDIGKWLDYYSEEFAELIAKEVIIEVWVQLFNHGIDLSENTLFLEAMKKTKEKFGVE